MNAKSISITVAGLLMGATSLFGLEPRTWRSTDGAAVEGVFEGLAGGKVTIQRVPDKRRFTFPVERLSEEDREYVSKAVALLRFRLRATQVKSDTDRKSRKTGTKEVKVTLPSGGTTTESRDIIEKYTLSSKTLKVETETPTGETAVTLEIYFLDRENGKPHVFEKLTHAITVAKEPTAMEFRSGAIEGFYGWAVVARTQETGEVIASQSSSYPVEQFVLGLPYRPEGKK